MPRPRLGQAALTTQAADLLWPARRLGCLGQAHTRLQRGLSLGRCCDTRAAATGSLPAPVRIACLCLGGLHRLWTGPGRLQQPRQWRTCQAARMHQECASTVGAEQEVHTLWPCCTLVADLGKQLPPQR